MAFEIAIACIVALLLWLLFRRTAGRWLDEYRCSYKKSRQDGEKEEEKDGETEEKGPKGSA